MRNLRAWYQIRNKRGKRSSLLGKIAGTDIEVALSRGANAQFQVEPERERDRTHLKSAIGVTSLKDETGTSNAIFTPNFFELHHTVITHGTIFLIEGELKNLDRTISVRMKKLEELHLSQLKTVSHDFY
jgi:hypothetical protein